MSTQERELYREASRGEVLRTVNSAFTEVASIPEDQLSPEEKAARNYAVLMKEKTIDQGKVAAPHAAVTGRLEYTIDETVPVDTLLNLLQKKIDSLPPDSPQRNELVETQKKLSAFSVNLNRQLDDRLLNVRIQQELAAIEADPERDTGDHDQNVALAGRIINNRLQLELPKYVVYVGAQHEDIRKRAEHEAELKIEKKLLELSKGKEKKLHKRLWDWASRNTRKVIYKNFHEFNRQKYIKENMDELSKANFASTNSLTEDAARQFNELRASGKATVERVRTGGVLGGEKVSGEGAVHGHLKTEINAILRDVVTSLAAADADRASIEATIQERLHAYVETHQDSQQIKEFFGKNSNDYGDLSKFYATDILDMAEKIQQDVSANLFSLDQLDQMTEVRLYRARWGEQTDTRTWVDKRIASLNKTRLGSIANPFVLSAGFSLANGAVGFGGRILGIATPIIGGGLSGARRWFDYKRARVAVSRQAERGMSGAGEKDKMRSRLESYIKPRMASVKELIEGGGQDLVQNATRESVADLLRDPVANRPKLLNRYAEIQARLDFALAEEGMKKFGVAGERKTSKIGVITYENGEISKGMLELTKQMAVIKRALLHANLSDEDFNRERDRQVGAWNSALGETSRLGERKSRLLAAGAAGLSAGIGFGIGVGGQEIGALAGRAAGLRVQPTWLESHVKFGEILKSGKGSWDKPGNVSQSILNRLHTYQDINLDGYQIHRDQAGTIKVFAEDAQGNITDKLVAKGSMDGNVLHFEQIKQDSPAAEAAWRKLKESMSVYDIGVEGETVVHETAVKVSEILKHAGAEQWADQFKLPTGEIVTADNHGNIGVFFPDEHKWLHGVITKKGTLLFDVNDPGNKGIDLAEVQKSLEGSGLKMSVTEGVGGEEVSVMDYFEKKGMVEKTERVGWWGYGQKGAQFNEKLFYFKLDKNGDIILDISKMKPDHDELAQAMHKGGNGYTFEEGKFEILITPDAAANKAREAIALEIGTDGKLKIPKGSDVAQLFEVKDGVVKTKACFVEVAQNIEGGRRILSTVVGPGIEEIQAGGGGNGSLEISFPGGLNGQMLGLENTTSFDITLNGAETPPADWVRRQFDGRGISDWWSNFNDKLIPDEDGWWHMPVTVTAPRPFLMPPTSGSAEATATAAAGRNLPREPGDRRERTPDPDGTVDPRNRFDVYSADHEAFITSNTPEEIARRFNISEDEARRLQADETARRAFLDERAANDAALEYVYRQYELTRRPELDGMIKTVVDGLPEEQRRMHERHNAVHNRIVTRIYNEIRPNMTAEQRRTLEERVRKEELDRANMNADQQTEYNEQYLPLAERIRQGVYDAMRANNEINTGITNTRAEILRAIASERAGQTEQQPPEDTPLNIELPEQARVAYESARTAQLPGIREDFRRLELADTDADYLSREDFHTKYGAYPEEHGNNPEIFFNDLFLNQIYQIHGLAQLVQQRRRQLEELESNNLAQQDREFLQRISTITANLSEDQRADLNEAIMRRIQQETDPSQIDDAAAKTQQIQIEEFARIGITLSPEDAARAYQLVNGVTNRADQRLRTERAEMDSRLTATISQWSQEIEAAQPAPAEQEVKDPDVEVVREALYEKAGKRNVDEMKALIGDVGETLRRQAEQGKGKLLATIDQIREKQEREGKEVIFDRGIVYIPMEQGNLISVGDLHGDYATLKQIINKSKFLENMIKGDKSATLVFMGDLIDRGQHDIEVMELVLDLKYRFPDNVIIMRADHETVSGVSDHDYNEKMLFHYYNGIYPGDYNADCAPQIDRLIRRSGTMAVLRAAGISDDQMKEFIRKMHTGEDNYNEEWKAHLPDLITGRENQEANVIDLLSDAAAIVGGRTELMRDDLDHKIFRESPRVVVAGNGAVIVHGGPSVRPMTLEQLRGQWELFDKVITWADPMPNDMFERKVQAERPEFDQLMGDIRTALAGSNQREIDFRGQNWKRNQLEGILGTMETLPEGIWFNKDRISSRELLDAIDFGTIAYNEQGARNFLNAIGGKVMLRGHQVSSEVKGDKANPFEQQFFFTLHSTGQGSSDSYYRGKEKDPRFAILDKSTQITALDENQHLPKVWG